MIEIRLHAPRVEGNRVRYAWSPSTGLFKADGYSVVYPDLAAVEGSPGKLAEGYFPLCLAFSFLPNVRVTLPARIDDEVFERWHDVFRTVAGKIARKPSAEIVNGTVPPHYRPFGAAGHTALFFGGGTESLLTLARFLESGVRPILASFGGPNWPGSNPADNPDKFLMDRVVTRDLDLKLLRVRTNFKDVFRTERWERHLKPNVSLINAAVSLPSFLSFLFPVAEQLGITLLVNGNERMNFPDEYFCFSPPVADRMGAVAKDVHYESHLGDLLKEDVCHELYRHYPGIAKYQYSCWRNRGERWCCRCQSCFEYFMLLNNNGIDPSHVGMERSKIHANLGLLIDVVARSPEGRPGEIWHRLIDYPRLRENPELKVMLDRVRRRAFWYHRVFFPLVPPKWFSRADEARIRVVRAVKAGRGVAARTVRAAREFSARAKRWLDAFYLDVWFLEGVTPSGQPLRAAYAGVERHKNYFAETAFARHSERYAGRLHHGAIEAAAAPHADLLVLEADGDRQRLFRASKGLKAPVWMMTEIDISDDLDSLRARPDFQNVRRRIRQNGYEPWVTRDPEIFDEFYDDLYLPYVKRAHGDTVYVEPREDLRRQFEEGELLVVKREGRIVAGELIHYEGEAGRLSSLGVRDGQEDEVRHGITDALIFFSVLRIKETGRRRAFLGYSRSFLTDGPLRYKSRMGAKVADRHHESSGYLVIRALASTAGVVRFFLDHPIITMDAGGGYRAAVFSETNGYRSLDDLKPLLKDRFCRGLKALDVYVFGEEAGATLCFPGSEPETVSIRPATAVMP